MDILTICLKSDICDLVVMKNIPAGNAVYNTCDAEEAKSFLKDKNIKLVIADTDESNFDVPTFIKRIKEIDKKNKYKIVVISGQSDQNFIKDMLNLGIVGFISKKVSISDMAKRLLAIISKLNFQIQDERRFIRVTPAENETLTINFNSPRSEVLINGKILNISMGGAAFIIDNKDYASLFVANDKIERIQIKINQKLLLTDGIIVFKKDDFSALKFQNVKPQVQNFLAKYIFQRMQKM